MGYGTSSDTDLAQLYNLASVPMLAVVGLLSHLVASLATRLYYAELYTTYGLNVPCVIVQFRTGMLKINFIFINCMYIIIH